MWANLFLLFAPSLYPVMTVWVRDQYEYPLPAAAYGLVAILAAIGFSFLVRTLIRVNGKDSAVVCAIWVRRQGVRLARDVRGQCGARVREPLDRVRVVRRRRLIWLVPVRRFAR